VSHFFGLIDFIGAHYGKGRVSVYEHTIFLESDFEVGPGPAFHVYLVPKASIRSTSDLKDAMFVDLGGLRAFKGSQRYSIRPVSI
jgi:Electron transfer DM13